MRKLEERRVPEAPRRLPGRRTGRTLARQPRRMEHDARPTTRRSSPSSTAPGSRCAARRRPPSCRAPVCVGSTCAPRFADRAGPRDPLLAESLVIHELLHTLGLGENPPDAARDHAACGRRAAAESQPSARHQVDCVPTQLGAPRVAAGGSCLSRAGRDEGFLAAGFPLARHPR